MKSNLSGFIPQERKSKGYYFSSSPVAPREYRFLEPYTRDDEEDGKVKGERAHYSYEFCRLQKLLDSCEIGQETDLEQEILSATDFLILEREKEIAMNFFKAPF
jgi:hypothetical protein